MSDRLRLAAQHAGRVVAADGLLARFNDAGVINPLDTLAASTISRLLGETDEVATLAAALTVRGTRFGHVCVDLDNLANSVVVDDRDRETVAALPWPTPDEWQAALSGSVLVDGGGDAPLVKVDNRLYLERYFRYEQRLAELISGRLDTIELAVAPTSRALLDRLLAPGGTPTSQHAAAVKALTGQVAVVAGGPGTGKTFTIGVMLAALAADAASPFPLIAVAAPTGKAAARLGESIADRAAELEDAGISARLATIAPSTIHRLLEWTWGRGRFRRTATNRLPHEIVIVDEMSMVSLPIAARLLEALRDDARLVMVGDPYQLESIEAGTVLADIVGPADTGSRPAVPIGNRVVVLDRGHRFQAGSPIDEFADAVRLGQADQALGLLSSSGEQLRWVPKPSGPAFDALWEEVVTRRRRVVELALSGSDPMAALTALSEMAVLCAHRRGPTGVSHWSREMELALDEHFPGLRWNGEWYPGRPVMITRNDYHLDLYNGDIGVAVNTEDGMRAVFDRGGLRRFPLSHLTEHTTVHALTIHKSQGSQFGQVMVVLPDDESPLLTRELLYTAVTRAADRVCLVGSEAVVRAAVGRSVPRASGLGTLLWGDSSPTNEDESLCPPRSGGRYLPPERSGGGR
ncbi:MAG TPA: exodeoxyribonuclease V subunit alpha [Acidimicrobiia bacterium]|nr:exodeoxyribonuclease V subunit alpha [Acidimicrobiia bacterium]